MRGALRLVCPAALVLAISCTRSKPLPPEPTEPWPAAPSSRPENPGLGRATFRLSGEQRLEFLLGTRQHKIHGRFRTLHGELTIDLPDLAGIRGTLEVDLESVSVDRNEKDEEDREATESARNWLGLGASRPASERQKLRWARFTVVRVENLEPAASRNLPDPVRETERAAARPEQAARSPEVLRDRKERSLRPEEMAGPAPGPAQARHATVDLIGILRLHGYEVELRVPVKLTLYYRGRAGPGEQLERLELVTRKPVRVSLDAHDIKPRDPSGNVLAQELARLDTTTGREAAVSVALVALPAR